MRKILVPLFLFAFGFTIAQSPRMSLYEEFTGETCPPCAATNPGLNLLLKAPVNASKIIAIKWQVPIPTAPSTAWSLYQTNKNEINWRAGSSAGGYGYLSQWTSTDNPTSGLNSAPMGLIDGQHQWQFGAQTDHPAHLTSAVIAAAQSYTSPYTITINRAWNSTFTAIEATVVIQCTATFTSQGLVTCRLVLAERNIHFASPPGSNGEKDFEDVARASFPSIQAGTSVSALSQGQSQTFTISCPLPSYINNKAECALVAFIQDDGSRMVLQAARADAQGTVDDAEASSVNMQEVLCAAPLAPTVQVKNHGTNAITGFTVDSYVDFALKSSYGWSGTLLPGANTVIALPTATALPGTRAFSYSITNVNGGTDSYLGNNGLLSKFIVEHPATTYTTIQTFSLGAFPPAGFAVLNKDNGASTWARAQVSGYGIGQGTAKYDFYNNSSPGDVDDLYIPATDLSAVTSQSLFFDVAHAEYPLYADRMDVEISTDCGSHWTTLSSKSGSLLATASPQTNEFSPGPTQWRTEVLDLSSYNSSQTLIRFRAFNANGNSLYLDNINISNINTVGLSKNSAQLQALRLIPNPSNDLVRIEATGLQGMVNVVLINALGQQVINTQLPSHLIEVQTAELPAGIYTVRLDNVAAGRLVVAH